MRRIATVTAGASALVVATHRQPPLQQLRHKSLYQRLHGLTEMKLANAYDKNKFSSKDVTNGPQYGAGFDPVFSHYIFTKMTGPLRRKQNTTPEDHLNVDEAEKWMDARQAAKVLGFKESELATLTRSALEERWVKLYSERSMAKQQEVLIATEVLLEYLDSTVAMKKSRQYYRKLLDNARIEIDQELELNRRGRNSKIMWACGVLMLGTSCAVMFVAFSRQYITRDDANTIGTMAKDYMNMTFLQPKNLEPKPDYSTRYFNTPTSMQMDKAAGRYDMQFLGADEVRLLEEKAEYDRREEAEMLKMLNDENERATSLSRDAAARDSRVAVYLPEELEADAAPKETKVERETKTTFDTMNFRQFSNMMARNFGGGSRIQRITEETSARAVEQQKIIQRMPDAAADNTAAAK